jgi:hypothetical protein
MGEYRGARTRRATVLIVCTGAALTGGVLAAAVTTAQGPGDYQPSTTTTTLPAQADARVSLSLKGTRGKQKLSGKVMVEASCGDEPCSVGAFGKLAIKVKSSKDERYKLKPDFVTLDANESATLKLKVPKDGLKLAKKKIERKDTKVKARIKVTANDRAGNERRKDRRIKLQAS